MPSATVASPLPAGVAYLAIGLLFGAIATQAGPGDARVAWRLVAWGASVAVFVAHVAYERRRHATRRAAMRVAAGVALGAFALAVAANLHAPAGYAHRRALGLSLVLWPLLTALPAFVAAAVLAWLMQRVRE